MTDTTGSGLGPTSTPWCHSCTAHRRRGSTGHSIVGCRSQGHGEETEATPASCGPTGHQTGMWWQRAQVSPQGQLPGSGKEQSSLGAEGDSCWVKHWGPTHSGVGQISSLKPRVGRRDLDRPSLLTPGPGAQGDPHLRSQPSEPGACPRRKISLLLRPAWATGDLVPIQQTRNSNNTEDPKRELWSPAPTGPWRRPRSPQGHLKQAKARFSPSQQTGTFGISASVKQFNFYKLKTESEVEVATPATKACLTMLDLRQSKGKRVWLSMSDPSSY